MDPAEFHYVIPMTVRFADLDVLQHLNHAAYLTYMEQARIMYIRDVCSWAGGSDQWLSLGMILARAEIEYKLPVAFGDSVQVRVRTSRLGGKSFDLEYVMTRQQEDGLPEVAASAKTVMVAYDYEKATTVLVPTEWRQRMIAHEPLLNED